MDSILRAHGNNLHGHRYADCAYMDIVCACQSQNQSQILFKIGGYKNKH